MTPEKIEFSVKDKNNPMSLVNLCPTVMAERIAAIPDIYLEMTEKELEHHYTPTKEDRLMRIAFIQELERCSRTDTTFNCANVYQGLVNNAGFYKSVITNSLRLAYIIKPFPEYQITLEELVHLGTDRMREILVRPAVTADGKFDHKLAALQNVVWEKVNDRLYGSITKKLEVESKSVNVNVERKASTPAEVDRQLRELEMQTTRTVQAIPYEEKEITEVIEVSDIP